MLLHNASQPVVRRLAMAPATDAATAAVPQKPAIPTVCKTVIMLAANALTIAPLARTPKDK